LRRFPLLFLIALFLFDTTQAGAQKILHRKKKVDKSTDSANTAEPDKQLYDKAMEDIKHGRHEVGRLGLQTLINTYPDSEYLAKAKLAIADSYYKEGGTANTTQAIAGYKDFIVFFPFLPEAAYAQMQVAMAHFNEMPKPDRDNTHARNAEEEFQTFLLKYPKDPLAPARSSGSDRRSAIPRRQLLLHQGRPPGSCWPTASAGSPLPALQPGGHRPLDARRRLRKK
jgi:outer membrane protein assembly factor BamD